MAIDPLNGLSPAGGFAPTRNSAPTPAALKESARIETPQPASALPTLPVAPAVKQLSDDVAKAFSASEVASNALQKQTRLIVQLRQLASEAASEQLDTVSRQRLSVQFQNLVSQLTEIAGYTQFAGKALFNGSFQLAVSTEGLTSVPPAASSEIILPDLSPEALFEIPPSVETPITAQQALPALIRVADRITQTQASLGNFVQTVSYAAAHVDTAFYNQQAASSTFGDGEAFSLPSSLQLYGKSAVQAQSNRLLPGGFDVIS